MLEHALHSPIPEFWRHWRPAMVALLAMLAVRLGRGQGPAGPTGWLVVGKTEGGDRMLERAGGERRPAPAPLAGPVGVLAGWLVLGWNGGGARLLDPQAPWPARLPVLGLIALLAGLGGRAGRAGRAAPALAAAAGAWWMAGGPATRPALLRALPMLLVLTAVAGLFASRLRLSSNWLVLGAGLSLWGALSAIGAPEPWPMAALVAAVGCLGTLGHAPAAGPPPDEAASAIGIAFCALAAGLAGGRLAAGRFSPTDAACLAPLAALLAAARLRRIDPLVGGALAAALGAGLAWLAGLGIAYGF